jgi:hypothetical protein
VTDDGNPLGGELRFGPGFSLPDVATVPKEKMTDKTITPERLNQLEATSRNGHSRTAVDVLELRELLRVYRAHLAQPEPDRSGEPAIVAFLRANQDRQTLGLSGIDVRELLAWADRRPAVETSDKTEPTRARLYSTIRMAIDSEARRINTPYVLDSALLKVAVEQLIIKFGWDPSEERDRIRLRFREVHVRLLHALGDEDDHGDPRSTTDLIDELHGERDQLRASNAELESQLAEVHTDYDIERKRLYEQACRLEQERDRLRAEVLRLNELGKKERAEGEEKSSANAHEAAHFRRAFNGTRELLERAEKELQAERAKVARALHLAELLWGYFAECKANGTPLSHGTVENNLMQLRQALRPSAPKEAEEHAGQREDYRRQAEAFNAKGGRLCGDCAESRAAALVSLAGPGWGCGECVRGCVWFIEQPEPGSPPHWRTGRSQSKTIYREDKLVAVVVTDEHGLAAEMVATLNRCSVPPGTQE